MDTEKENEQQNASGLDENQNPGTDSAPPPPDSEENKIVYINFIPPNPSDGDFWNDVRNADVKRKKPGAKLWIAVAVILIAALFCYAILLTHGKISFKTLFGDNRIEFTLPIAETPQLDEKYYNSDGTYTSAGLVKAVLPSVVQIQVYSQNAVQPSSQGSGIIISEDGYIVTNAHVVTNPDYGVTVMLYDKTEYIASIVGSDSSSDIAVLKIGASGLTPAQFADSDTCELGDEVVTVGSPAGLENSVTKGIISGLDRQIHSESSSTSMNCIQIDAAINPGNSGGPLFNMWGQVIGINSSKLVSSSYDNIGFAITVNAAKPIIEELMEKGYVADKARIGITYYAISEEKAELMNVEPGLCVVSIDEDCNIAETEIQQGDIIMELNGTPTSDNDAVSEVMNGLEPGDKMTCKVYRPSTEENASVEDGEYFEITFKLNSDKNSFVQTDE